jgi:hypothetical protein
MRLPKISRASFDSTRKGHLADCGGGEQEMHVQWWIYGSKEYKEQFKGAMGMRGHTYVSVFLESLERY